TAFLNNGDGTLSKPASLAFGISRTGVVLTDIDGDGLDDVVTANVVSSVSVYPNLSPIVASVKLDKNSVSEGSYATLTISLARPAPDTGAVATLSASNPAVAFTAPNV